MDIRLMTDPADIDSYTQWIKDRSHATLWQSLDWKTYQEALGREVRIYRGEKEDTIQCTALVVIDRTKGGYSTWEIPRGPLWHSGCSNENVQLLLDTICKDAMQDKCMSIYISCLGEIPNTRYKIQDTSRHIHPVATRLIDLTQSDDDILKQMKPKGRYNIKVARKHNVRVEQSIDIANYYILAKETAERDGFTIPSKKTFEAFLHDLEGSFLFLAYADDTQKPIAGLLGAVHDQNGIYYYGASSHAYRALMAPYLLQWEAMQFCKQQGCATYDLLGVAPPDAEDNHPWAGISKFKEKFGGEVVEYPEEKEIVLRPFVKEVFKWKRKLLG